MEEPGSFARSPAFRTAVLERAFHAKARAYLRAQKRARSTRLDEDEDQPDDWWIALAPEDQRGNSERVTKILGQ